ncbi:MAG: hypothetical protein KKI08_09860 [Armatimonadetes bacterium]|nr:hypothetical protein [Armatimonadota bacterium]
MAAVQLELCPAGEAAALEGFTEEHWRAGHILAHSRALLDWQHLDRAASRYNFVLARRGPGGDVVGGLGFIPNSHFDPALADTPDLWLAIWKVVPEAAPPGVGVAMLQYALAQTGARSVTAIGINGEVSRLYRALGCTIFSLEQHFQVNADCGDCRLLDGWSGPAAHPAAAPGAEVALVALDEAEFVAAAATCPDLHDANITAAKTPEYLRRRFYNHPLYEYLVCAVRQGGEARAFAVFRRAEAEGAAALRMVDWLGPVEAMAGLAGPLQTLLHEQQAEYVDFYCYGFAAEVLQAAGFMRREPESRVIVPSYFEPFERRNVEILCAHRALQPGLQLRCTRADADQDRPSRLPEDCP